MKNPEGLVNSFGKQNRKFVNNLGMIEIFRYAQYDKIYSYFNVTAGLILAVMKDGRMSISMQDTKAPALSAVTYFQFK